MIELDNKCYIAIGENGWWVKSYNITKLKEEVFLFAEKGDYSIYEVILEKNLDYCIVYSNGVDIFNCKGKKLIEKVIGNSYKNQEYI